MTKKSRGTKREIDPEDILLDARNLPSYNAGRLEGRLAFPIDTRAMIPLVLVIVVVCATILARTGQLMALEGDTYAALSEENRLGHSRILAERGVIYDRRGVELVQNTPDTEQDGAESYYERAYASSTGSGHVLGYVRMPARDRNGVLYQEGIEGVAGVEYAYDEQLRGKDGVEIIETDARLDAVSSAVLERPVAGMPLALSIDIRLQTAMNGFIKDLADKVPFSGGAALMMDVKTGELLMMTSYPEYDPAAVMQGDAEKIASYANDPRTPYLNRTLAGQYTPGSIVKPFLALAALNEGIVRPETTFLSTGSIRVANPYAPGEYTSFADWRAHGLVDLRRAIAVSSDVYFYYVGGGFGDQEGLGISRIDAYMRLFGFGAPTNISLAGERSGIIPTPEWKEEQFPDDPVWRIGDTYHTAIGQYGVQVTPLQIVRAVAAIANGGWLLTPRIETQYTQYGARHVDLPAEYYTIVHEGMRQAVTDGTAKAIDVPYLVIGGKTGTAEVGYNKDFVHSWVVGFYPYDAPRYAFVVLMEHGPRTNLVGASSVMRQFLDWMHVHTPEYVNGE